MLIELRECFPHALFVVDGSIGFSTDELLSLANQDRWIEINASIRAVGGCLP